MAISADTQRVLAAIRAVGADEPAARHEVGSDGESRWPWRIAAAVLHVFDPAAINPYEKRSEEGSGGGLDLIDESAAAIGFRAQSLRTLNPDLRREAISRLHMRSDLRAALAANPERVPTPLQRLIDSFADGEPFDLDSASHEDLTNVLELYDWGLQRICKLPAIDTVRQRRRLRSITASFDHLIANGFVGRQSETLRLREFLRKPSVASTGNVLYIQGSGGVGKTGLLGNFLNTTLRQGGRHMSPFAYLSLHDRSLDVQEIRTLLVEVSRQWSFHVEQVAQLRDSARTRKLKSVIPTFRRSLDKYRVNRKELARRGRAATGAGDRVREDARLTDDVLLGAFEKMATDLSELLKGVLTRVPMPLLIVLDTFEELEYRAQEELLGFWRMLSRFRERLPFLRIVIAGRSPCTEELSALSAEIMTLGDLNKADSVEVLRRFGDIDPDTANRIFESIGGNPLNLRLAADAIGRSGNSVEGIFRGDLADIGPEIIRGYLYTRILDHIHDDDVRKLAHPGMVLRRVTPRIISEVLAPTLGFANMSAVRAKELFEELKREHSLVHLLPEGELEYREEVRRPMLKLLTQDKPFLTRRIHEAAFDFYRSPTSVRDSAEAIYHAMMMGQGAQWLDEYWKDGVQKYLATAIEELPPDQRVLLARHMSIALSKSDLDAADVMTAEAFLGRSALEAYRHASFDRALSVLDSDRRRRPDSPLYAIEARVLAALGRDASELIAQALAQYPPGGNIGRRAELLWLLAQARLRKGDAAEAIARLEQLAELARSLPSSLPETQALAELHVQARSGGAKTDTVRENLVLALSRLTQAEILREDSVVRLALAQVGLSNFALFARLAGQTLEGLRYRVSENPKLRDEAVRLALEFLGDPERGYKTMPTLHYMGDLTPSDIAREGARWRNENSTPTREFWQWLDVAVRDIRENLSASPLLADQLLKVLRADDVSLADATLAGIDSYREPWEAEASSRVSAA